MLLDKLSELPILRGITEVFVTYSLHYREIIGHPDYEGKCPKHQVPTAGNAF